MLDLTNGWNGKPPAGDHVYVVTHDLPGAWEHADSAPFTFVTSVEEGIAAAREMAVGSSMSLPGRSAARR